MKQSKPTIAILCILLIFSGAILRDLIPLTADWQHDIGLIVIVVGFLSLFRIIREHFSSRNEG